MKFQLDAGSGNYVIRGYRSGTVIVNDEALNRSFILSPHQLVREWEPRALEDLHEKHWTPVLELDPELVILGTGDTLRFPSPIAVRPLIEQGIGYEVMDNSAACRSYAILMAEGRRITAAFLL